MKIDYSKPIEIMPDIYWVGYLIPNDPFQCQTECGLYLMGDYESDLKILNKADELIKKIFHNLLTQYDLNLILKSFLFYLKQNIPSIEEIEICGINPVKKNEVCFKKVNDAYGHLTGDCILKSLAKEMEKNFRQSDYAFRYGGEEFLIIMPFTKQKDACIKMEKFREFIENKSFCKKNIKITISGGVVEYNSNYKIKDFIDKIDKKLYIAKNSGRNKIIC
ncbi:GGDEF domain-containing protein [Lebetimonas sp. JS032]|uniref:GGDEF domain-containing protein n=1 Tax=Lebetimonas sp. JS032 TaxID=990070 RepID=UPI000466A728|nr:GGDEF domain-containing protein [Lebetimonas sp. JS032]